MECADFSKFQEALTSMRKADDIIVSTINSVIPTDSFHADKVVACNNIFEQIQYGYNKREELIKNCILYTTYNVKKLKSDRDGNLDNIQIKKSLKAEQTKLRMLQVELSVEDLVKQRSLKVFSEKCRRFFKTTSS